VLLVLLVLLILVVLLTLLLLLRPPAGEGGREDEGWREGEEGGAWG
jgi:preprotein translocase subunit SecG